VLLAGRAGLCFASVTGRPRWSRAARRDSCHLWQGGGGPCEGRARLADGDRGRAPTHRPVHPRSCRLGVGSRHTGTYACRTWLAGWAVVVVPARSIDTLICAGGAAMDVSYRYAGPISLFNSSTVYDSDSIVCIYIYILLGFMGLAQLRISNKSQENLKSPYKWMAKG
jgi:hypothetical protein